MSSKTVILEDIGAVSIHKRKGQRSIRLSISSGKIRVSQPAWLPFSAGETFLRSKADWIAEHHKPKNVLTNGSTIGKQHQLAIHYGSKLSSKIKQGIITINLPFGESEISPKSQLYIQKIVRKALRTEAETFLPIRTRILAEQHGFNYHSVQIKHLKRRWGSCSSKKEITYNLYLMNLSYEYIDYLILHELTHTLHMNHGADFWKTLESVHPGARKVAKLVRKEQSI